MSGNQASSNSSKSFCAPILTRIAFMESGHVRNSFTRRKDYFPHFCLTNHSHIQNNKDSSKNIKIEADGKYSQMENVLEPEHFFVLLMCECNFKRYCRMYCEKVLNVTVFCIRTHFIPVRVKNRS